MQYMKIEDIFQLWLNWQNPLPNHSHIFLLHFYPSTLAPEFTALPPPCCNIFTCSPEHPLMMHFTTNHPNRNTNPAKLMRPSSQTELEPISRLCVAGNVPKFILQNCERWSKAWIDHILSCEKIFGRRALPPLHLSDKTHSKSRSGVNILEGESTMGG